MKTKFLIGEFAEISGISKQTLRFYDKKDVLKPKEISPNNKYRYYYLEQIYDLEIILLLKELGMALDEIKSYMKNKSVDNSISLLKNNKILVEKKIKDLKKIKKKIENELLRIDQKVSDEKTGQVIIKKLKKEYFKVLEPKNSSDSEITYSFVNLFRQMEAEGLEENGKSGVINLRENIYNGEYSSYKQIFVGIEKKAKNDCITRENGNYLSIIHKGPYKTTDESYKKLIEFSRENNLDLIGDFYEENIIDFFSVNEEDEYLTEIIIKFK